MDHMNEIYIQAKEINIQPILDIICDHNIILIWQHWDSLGGSVKL